MALGTFDLVKDIGGLASVQDWQLSAQMRLFGVSRHQLEIIQVESGWGAREPGRPEQPSVVYLRPLSTARRELVQNRFLCRNEFRHSILPESISLEAALHIALTPDFDGEALGGPLDVFGMKRSSTLGKGNDHWRETALMLISRADLICVLLAESDGLSWELGEIRRHGASGKTIFIVSPRYSLGAPLLSSRAQERLATIGYSLPEQIEPGFLLLDANGNCERQVPFDWLWDGRLRRVLWDKLSSR